MDIGDERHRTALIIGFPVNSLPFSFPDLCDISRREMGSKDSASDVFWVAFLFFFCLVCDLSSCVRMACDGVLFFWRCQHQDSYLVYTRRKSHRMYLPLVPCQSFPMYTGCGLHVHQDKFSPHVLEGLSKHSLQWTGFQ
jgi:hypothetical protein